jgi:predicted nucleic acid-binding protein
MIYLVDANVLSEPTKPAPRGEIVDWLAAHEPDLVVDSIILGELYLGILSLPRGRKRTRLERWFEDVAQTIVCLAWDAAVSRRWASLVAVLDSMIAATALQHDLTIATRNTRDFSKTGAKVLDPFKSRDVLDRTP